MTSLQGKTCTAKFILIHTLFMQARYGGQIKSQVFQELVKVLYKAVQIMNFLPFNSSNLNKTYNDCKILKLPGFILLRNSLFVKDLFEKELLRPFINYFQKARSQHSHRMCSAFKNCFCTKS